MRFIHSPQLESSRTPIRVPTCPSGEFIYTPHSWSYIKRHRFCKMAGNSRKPHNCLISLPCFLFSLRFLYKTDCRAKANPHPVAARLVVVDCSQGFQPEGARTCYCIKDCLQGKLYDNFPLSTNGHPPSNVKHVPRLVVSGKNRQTTTFAGKLCTDAVGEKESNHA